MSKKRLVIGMSGASGTPLAVRTLQALREVPEVETHLVATESAALTAGYEGPLSFEQIVELADVYYEGNPIDAAIASGTFQTAGMLVVPCSMKSAAGIANGFSDNLLLRAADVCVKEKRPLVLAARETPLSPIHLRNLQTLASLPQVWIMPPMMTWYMKPQSIEEMEHHLVAKMLAPFGIEVPAFHWGE
ncbi:MAG: UbiX family flavin prenyltransferase [Coriobacteriia bacterium]|nr:UbiX family flavin prenyltransferase [Coriobacteriia bacterium]